MILFAIKLLLCLKMFLKKKNLYFFNPRMLVLVIEIVRIIFSYYPFSTNVGITQFDACEEILLNRVQFSCHVWCSWWQKWNLRALSYKSIFLYVNVMWHATTCTRNFIVEVMIASVSTVFHIFYCDIYNGI